MAERDLYFPEDVTIESNSGDKRPGTRGAGPLADVIDANVHGHLRQATKPLLTRENWHMRGAKRVAATGVTTPREIARFAPLRRQGK